MAFWEIGLMGLIAGGAGLLLYRSFRKKGGCCAGCGSGMCEMKTSGGLENGSKTHCDEQGQRPTGNAH